MSYRARKRWAVVILVLGIPLYIIMAVNLVAGYTYLFGRPSLLVELFIYVGLGVIWAFPLKSIFKGIGQADPDAEDP